MLDEIKGKLPELPHVRLKRYIEVFGLSTVDANILIQSMAVSDFFNEALLTYNNPKSLSAFILGELLRRINLGEMTMENIPFSAKEFAQLVEMADNEKVSKNDAKTILRYMVETSKSPVEIAKEHGFLIEVDTTKVENTIDSILSANEAIVAQYIAGEQKVFGFLMGLCNKELKGLATPKIIKETLEAKLKSLSEKIEISNTDNNVDEVTVTDTSKLTLYKNEGAFKPQEKGSLRTLKGENLQTEFNLEDVKSKIGSEIELSAVVHRVKEMGNISFIVLRTGRNVVQSVYSTDSCSDSRNNFV